MNFPPSYINAIRGFDSIITPNVNGIKTIMVITIPLSITFFINFLSPELNAFASEGYNTVDTDVMDSDKTAPNRL